MSDSQTWNILVGAATCALMDAYTQKKLCARPGSSTGSAKRPSVSCKDKPCTTTVFKTLRKMKTLRQIEATELMVNTNNYSVGYISAILAEFQAIAEMAPGPHVHSLAISTIFYYFLESAPGEAFAPMSNDILTIREVAEYLKINEKTAYRLAAEDKLPGFKVGGAWRFRKDEIEKLTKGQTTQDEDGNLET